MENVVRYESVASYLDSLKCNDDTPAIKYEEFKESIRGLNVITVGNEKTLHVFNKDNVTSGINVTTGCMSIRELEYDYSNSREAVLKFCDVRLLKNIRANIAMFYVATGVSLTHLSRIYSTVNEAISSLGIHEDNWKVSIDYGYLCDHENYVNAFLHYLNVYAVLGYCRDPEKQFRDLACDSFYFSKDSGIRLESISEFGFGDLYSKSDDESRFSSDDVIFSYKRYELCVDGVVAWDMVNVIDVYTHVSRYHGKFNPGSGNSNLSDMKMNLKDADSKREIDVIEVRSDARRMSVNTAVDRLCDEVSSNGMSSQECVDADEGEEYSEIHDEYEGSDSDYEDTQIYKFVKMFIPLLIFGGGLVMFISSIVYWFKV